MSQISAFGGRITVDKPDFYFSPTESYGVLGWVETGIMILAGIAGVISLFSNPSTQGIKEKLIPSRLGQGSSCVFSRLFLPVALTLTLNSSPCSHSHWSLVGLVPCLACVPVFRG
jgi:hypothetical protein